MSVLDVGSGIAGPSRHLARSFGCVVTGLNLIEEYCAVAACLPGDDFPAMAANLPRNLREARIIPTEIVCRSR